LDLLQEYMELVSIIADIYSSYSELGATKIGKYSSQIDRYQNELIEPDFGADVS